MVDEEDVCVVCHSAQISHQGGLCPKHTYDDDRDRVVNAVEFYLANRIWVDGGEKKEEYERLLVSLRRVRSHGRMYKALVDQGWSVPFSRWLVDAFLGAIDEHGEVDRERVIALWRRGSELGQPSLDRLANQLTTHYDIIEGAS